MSLLQTYLQDLYAIYATGAGVKETSYYPALNTLFNTLGKGLKPTVRCIIHLQNQGAGLPDGGFFTPDQIQAVGDGPMLPGLLPSRGVLEVKGAADHLEKLADSAQVARYWERYGQVLVTNLRGFALVVRDSDGVRRIGEHFTLAPTEAAFWAMAARPESVSEADNARFTEYLSRALLQAAPLATPEDVAWFLASYARDARSRIETADMPSLAAVRTALEEALGLQFTGIKGEHFFRSTLVQTLFYGIFSAWVLWCKRHPLASGARFSWKEAAWELHVPMIRALFEQIATPTHLGRLGLVEVLEWTGAALGRVDRASFFARFDQGQAVQYFYEPFLQAFDPELRRDLGVWYTPPEIVRYMVARVDTVLRDELGLADGLADPSVYVLDPCCGTGAYLVEVLRVISETLDAGGGDALGGSDLKQAAMTRVFGFEILPAPFVVAHLQLGLLLQSAGAPLSDEKSERVGVYLTNALTGWEPPKEPKGHLLFPEMEQERDAADQVKQQKPILVILGNPPYNGYAGVSPDEEEGLLEPYKRGLKDWGITKNYLDDLYVRFFRLAERRISANEGVVCYISNFSYLSDPSFVVMRQRFLKEFDKLWFDRMNGDSRETGKVTPDGKPDPSVFSTDYNREGIRVGTAIGLMVRKKQRDAEPTVNFRQFWGVTKRADLLESLDAPNIAPYLPANPTRSNRFSFRPSDVSADYEAWPDVASLSAVKPMLGLNDNRGQATHSISRDEIEHRMKAYYDPAVSFEEISHLHSGLTTNAASFDAKATRNRLQGESAFDSENTYRFWFKPFDLRWAYIERKTNLWNRIRPDLINQAWPGNQFLMARCHAPKAHDGATFYWSRDISDQHALHTDAYFIPILLREAPTKEEQTDLFGDTDIAEKLPKANLSPMAREYLASLGIDNPDADAETASLLWMHALAIGYSPAYLTENADGIRGDWPRIPLPATREHLEASAALGREVAALLDTETPVPGVTTGSIRDELKTLGPITRVGGGTLTPDSGDLRITAGWGHAGKEGVTMPGQGRSVSRDFTAAEAEPIGPDAMAILGPGTRDVYLNDVAYWRNVPTRVWEYTIGGYQVMKKWLSYREAKLLGRDLTPAEVREVMGMIRRIAALILGESARDANYQGVK